MFCVGIIQGGSTNGKSGNAVSRPSRSIPEVTAEVLLALGRGSVDAMLISGSRDVILSSFWSRFSHGASFIDTSRPEAASCVTSLNPSPTEPASSMLLTSAAVGCSSDIMCVLFTRNLNQKMFRLCA